MYISQKSLYFNRATIGGQDTQSLVPSFPELMGLLLPLLDWRHQEMNLLALSRISRFFRQDKNQLPDPESLESVWQLACETDVFFFKQKYIIIYAQVIQK